MGNKQGMEYLCYVLRSGRRHYIGCTNNFGRRLRQHNGELAGGAKATRGGRPWTPVAVVVWFSRVDALRYEWRLKRKRNLLARVEHAQAWWHAAPWPHVVAVSLPVYLF